MKKNNGGFTLVELLAVIVILGLLMAIAIPSVTKYITQSRKKTLISSIDSYVTAVSTAVNDNEFGPMSKEDTMYYIPVSDQEDNSCISLEKGGTNPFGNWKEAYVVVNYDATNYSYDYYFTFYDDAGYGLALTEIDKISLSGDMIKNPSPVNADNIKTQTNDRASNIKILTTSSCNVLTAVTGGNITKVTTLAGTTWTFKNVIDDFSIFDTFNYEEQTGWDDFPYNTIVTNGTITYQTWGLSAWNFFGIYGFGTVQSIGEPYNFGYFSSNDGGIEEGWYTIDNYTNVGVLEGTITTLEEAVRGIKTTIPPTITFPSVSSSTLEDQKLIDFMYDSATMK